MSLFLYNLINYILLLMLTTFKNEGDGKTLFVFENTEKISEVPQISNACRLSCIILLILRRF